MAVTAEMVNALRKKTGLPMMDCKKALLHSGGNEAGAIDWLKEQGMVRSAKMADREAGDGRIACHVSADRSRGGIVELRCETAPVAGTQDFIELAQAAAEVAAGMDAPTPDAILKAPHPRKQGLTVGDQLNEVFNRIRENMKIARADSFRNTVGYYVHHDGRKGTMVSMSADCPNELRTDVCMHVTAIMPSALRREDVAAAEVDEQRKRFAEEAAGKPPQVAEKIITGKLDRWFAEFVLLEQPFVKDDKQSVGQVLKAAVPELTVSRFVRYEVGRS